MHEADIALGNQVRERQAVAAILPRHLDHKPQMAGDETVGGSDVLVVAPGAAKGAFFLGLEQRKALDLGHVAAELGTRRILRDRKGRQIGRSSCVRHRPPSLRLDLGCFRTPIGHPNASKIRPCQKLIKVNGADSGHRSVA